MDFVSFFNAVKPPYEIEQSLRFDGGSKLERTNSDNGDSRSFTLSYWIKKTYLGDNNNSIVGTNDGASNWSYISYGESSSDPDQLLARSSGSGSGYSNAYVFNAQRKHRDPSAWQHHFLVVDKTAGTSKGYINGVLDEGDGGYGGTRSSNGWTLNGTTATVRIGAHSQTGTSNYLNGYLAEWHFVDGTAMDVTDFGEFDDYGVWRPINPSISSYGTNGYYLKFDSTAANGVGHDHSGNGNNWSASGFTTSGSGTDVMNDTPTTNWATLNSIDPIAVTFSEGSLKAAGTNNWETARSTIAMTTGKWYWEVTPTHSSSYVFVGVVNKSANITQYVGQNANGWGLSTLNGNITNNASGSAYGSATASGVVLGFAFDADTGKMWVRNASGFFNSGDPAAGTNPAMTAGAGEYYVGLSAYETSASNTANFGQRDFSYTPPTGFKALNTANLPAPTIKGGSENFSANTWTGNGTTNNALTGFGHQPDFVWGKARNQAYAHALFDSVRGGGYRVYNTGTTPPAQDYLAEYIKSFDSDGITLGSDGNLNGNNVTYAGWSWKGGGNTGKTYTVKVVSDSGNKYRFDDFGTSAVTLSLAEGGTYVFDQSDSSNSGHPLRFSTTSDGTHNSGSEYTTGVTVTGTPGQAGAKTTIVVAASAPTLYYYCSVHSGMGGQADTTTTLGSSNFDGSIATVANPNPTGGFSVIKYTSNGTSGATIGHGLGVAPAFFIVKNIDATDHYSTYHQSLGNTKALLLNSANAPYTATAFWNNTSPTSSVITLGNETSTNNSDSDDYICWAWAEVEGYSKFGSYSGGDGVFVYLGFKPSLLILKGTVGTRNWIILDSERSTYNVVDDVIHPNLANSESVQGSSSVDFVSNGFVTRGGNISGSGDLTVFAAFAENPFGGDGVSPATAR